MQQITYEQIKKFCDDDPIRPILHEPRLIDGRWYASDGHFIISIPEAIVKYDESFEKNKIECNYPDVKRFLQEESVKADKTVDVSIIEAAFIKLPMIDEEVEKEFPIKYIDCPCCRDGKIEVSDSVLFKNHWIGVDAEVDCPVCHGYGKIPDWDDYDPENDDEYDPKFDTTYTKMVKTGNKVPDFHTGSIICDGIKVMPYLLKTITDFFHSIGTEKVNYEARSGACAIMLRA